MIIAIANQKGGVGKTTTTLTLGHALVQAGRRVLLVDLDPQASLTLHAGFEILNLQHSLAQVLLSAVRGSPPDALHQLLRQTIQPTSIESMHLLPTNLDLSAVELQLFAAFSRERVLARVLAPLKTAYDDILIDCPPALGLFTINALTAADKLVIPVATDFLSLRGAQLLIDQTLPTVQAHLNPGLELLAILPTLFDERTLHARSVLQELKNLYALDRVLEPVRQTVRFKEAANIGTSVLPMLDEDAQRPYRLLAARIVHARSASPA